MPCCAQNNTGRMTIYVKGWGHQRHRKDYENRILRDCGEICSNTYFEVISPT